MRTLTINGDPSVPKFTVFQFPGKTATPVAGFPGVKLASTASSTKATLDYHHAASEDKLKPFKNFEPNQGYCTYSSKQFLIEGDGNGAPVTSLKLTPSGKYHGWNIFDYPFAAAVSLSSYPQIRLVKIPAASRQFINFAVYQGHLPPNANEVTKFEPNKSYMALVSSEVVINDPVPPTPTPTATPTPTPKPSPTPTPTPVPAIVTFVKKSRPSDLKAFPFMGTGEEVLNYVVAATIDGVPTSKRPGHLIQHYAPLIGNVNKQIDITTGTGHQYSFFMATAVIDPDGDALQLHEEDEHEDYNQNWLARRNNQTGKWTFVAFFSGKKLGSELAFTNSSTGLMQWGTDAINSCSWDPLLRPEADYLDGNNILRFVNGLSPLPGIVTISGTSIGIMSTTNTTDFVLAL